MTERTAASKLAAELVPVYEPYRREATTKIIQRLLDEQAKEKDAEIERLRIYEEAIKSRHNGYDVEARKAMPTLKEPRTPDYALDQLLGEMESIGIAFGKAQSKIEIDRLKKQLEYYESALCHDANLLRALPSGDTVKEIDVKKVTDVLAENSRLRAACNENKNIAVD